MQNYFSTIPHRSDLEWCGYLRRQGPEGEAMERVLHDIGVMVPGGWADWAPSRLTAVGAPIEMQFTQHASGLRLRTEVADPASDPVNRVSQVCRTMTRLGDTAPDFVMRDVLGAAQSSGTLNYGAWCDLHQTGKHLRSQLCAELPADAQDLIQIICPPRVHALLHPDLTGIRATMVCIDGATGTREMHFIARNTDAMILERLASAACVSHPMLVSAVRRLTGHRGADGQQFKRLGFSLLIGNQQDPPVLKLHFAAAKLFKTDRAAAAYLTSKNTAPIRGYQHLIDVLPATARGRIHHGLVHLIAQKDYAPWYSASVAAPWAYLPSLVVS